MKLYNHKLAPNPRRVRIFAAEKGIALPTQDVDITGGENKEPWFLEKNPLGSLPVLELDDGTCLAESMAICLYLELVNPNVPLMGEGATERAHIEMWNRRMELSLFSSVSAAFRHSPKKGEEPSPELGETFALYQQRALDALEILNSSLSTGEFVSGAKLTVADITAYAAIGLGTMVGVLDIPTELGNVTRWHTQVSARPAFSA